jgi:hypothetical protein
LGVTLNIHRIKGRKEIMKVTRSRNSMLTKKDILVSMILACENLFITETHKAKEHSTQTCPKLTNAGCVTDGQTLNLICNYPDPGYKQFPDSVIAKTPITFLLKRAL